MDKYTTVDLKSKDLEKEKDKIIISNESYALTEAINKLTSIMFKPNGR